MTDRVTQKNTDDQVPTEKKLDDLYKLIDGIEVAMLTTRKLNGQLVSRPMQTQRRTAGADLWFVTNWFDDKLDELALDPQCNVAYYRPGTGEWVSVSGTAIISRDRDLVQGLYKPDWKAFFPVEEGNPKRDGSADDERIALVLVEAESVVYSKLNKPRPMVLFQLIKSMVTGSAPKMGDLRHVSEQELRQDVGRELR